MAQHAGVFTVGQVTTDANSSAGRLSCVPAQATPVYFRYEFEKVRHRLRAFSASLGRHIHWSKTVPVGYFTR